MTDSKVRLECAYIEKPMKVDVRMVEDGAVVGTLEYSIIHCPDGKRTLETDRLVFNIELQSFEEFVLLIHNLMDYQLRYAAIYGQAEFKHQGGLVMDRPAKPEYPIFIGHTTTDEYNVNIEDHHKCLSLQANLQVKLSGDQWGLAMVQILRKVMSNSVGRIKVVSLRHKDDLILG